MCFGYFLDMQKLEIFGQLIHHFRLKKMECDDDKVMEFNLNGSDVRIVDKKFTMVARLKLNSNIEDLKSEIQDIKTNIHTKHFKTLRKITKKNLLKIFENA